MNLSYTIQDVLNRLPSKARHFKPLPSPEFKPELRNCHQDDEWLRIGFAIKSMEQHTTNEGWELFRGLNEGGKYLLCGHGIQCVVDTGIGVAQSLNATDVRFMLTQNRPCTVVIQDKREYEGLTAGPGFNPLERFTNVTSLAERTDVFKLTILKDAHARPDYHMKSAEEIGCHAWIVYYHPKIVAKLAPYVREQHLVRTYHTVDSSVVPPYSPDNRNGCLISGAVSSAYPLRMALVEALRRRKMNWDYLRHPGYGRDHCHTPEYIQRLSKYKVAVCTASIYGYALRKIIEATAAGCVVVTDLPADEHLPEIDGNLLRVHPNEPTNVIAAKVHTAIRDYNPIQQESFAERAKAYYDYRVMGKRLADQIETLRRNYSCT